MRQDGRPQSSWRRAKPSSDLTSTSDAPLHRDELDVCREAWEVANNPGAILEALRILRSPRWLLVALTDQQKLGRPLHQAWRKYERDLVHYLRAEEVSQALEHGFSWEDATALASDALAKTPAAGSSEGMKKSYQLVKRQSKGGGHWRYRLWHHGWRLLEAKGYRPKRISRDDLFSQFLKPTVSQVPRPPKGFRLWRRVHLPRWTEAGFTVEIGARRLPSGRWAPKTVVTDRQGSHTLLQDGRGRTFSDLEEAVNHFYGSSFSWIEHQLEGLKVGKAKP